MTDPAKPLGAEEEKLLDALHVASRIQDAEFRRSEYRTLLTSFLSSKAEEIWEQAAKACDGIKAQYVQAHYDAHGHITEGPYSAGAWDAADKCAAAIRALGKGEK